jgi:uncharacterized damage-inducible protein DinB
MRWKGTSPKVVFDPLEFPDLGALKTKWAEVERAQTTFVNAATDDALDRVIAYFNIKGEQWRYPLRHMMQHVVNHSSYHRGQVATMLRQLGAEPKPTDFLVFFDVTSPDGR